MPLQDTQLVNGGWKLESWKSGFGVHSFHHSHSNKKLCNKMLVAFHKQNSNFDDGTWAPVCIYMFMYSQKGLYRVSHLTGGVYL